VSRLLAAVVSADPGRPQIRVLDGMAGSGKTTIAVHLADLVRERFPDARLFIDLHGHSVNRPVEPAAALVTLLRQLGMPADRIPDDLDERIQLWRAELAGRRALVVLDNAASTAQVAPLLPASGLVLVLVTSRRRLIGLDAVRPESLSVLPEPEAIALLARIVGDRVGAELTIGDRAGARDSWLSALSLARRTGMPYEQARALAGLAECAAAQDQEAARRYWQQALDIFVRMSAPDRFDVERRLAGLDSGPDQLRTPAGGGRMEA
jgi:hypothetical protein